MALEVIGAGFPRNGTMSLRAAFEKLGYAPSYHMSEVIAPRPGLNDGHIEAWADFLEGKRLMDWAWLMEHYRACCDFPASAFYKELAEVWPDARVVLTLRDPEKWYASYATLMRATRPLFWGGYVVPRLRQFRRVTEGLDARVFEGRRLDRDVCIRAYERHNEEVKRTIPAERLLVFDLKDGWEPLCDFLGKPIPEEPFPHLNEGRGLGARVRKMLPRIVMGRWSALRRDMDDQGTDRRTKHD
jgi:hypothetical protein